MHAEKVNAGAEAHALVVRNIGAAEQLEAHGRYEVTCRDKDGRIKWVDSIENLVTTVGKNNMLDNHFAGSAYTAAWYMGLVNATPTYAAGDTMSSHAGWTENTGYSEGARPTCAFSAASAGSKALSSALAFSITATSTIAGCFVVSNATKGGTTGTLFSCGSFSGGNRAVVSGDTLNVSYSCSV